MSKRSATRSPPARRVQPTAATRHTDSRDTIGRLLTYDVRGLLRRIPKAAWICALVACLNAAGWSLITPAFEVPDEPAHFAYVKQLVDTGTRPNSKGEFASEIKATMEGLRYYFVIEQPENGTVGSQTEQAELKAIASKTNGSSVGSQSAGVATSQPPLYYALEGIPYSIAKGQPIPDRLQLMRLFSALFAGLTALFAFMFIRETLPGEPWAWVVGGLAIALAPLLGFMSGAVNPDSMLYAVSAATFYLLARAFRRGLDTRMALAIGAVTAIGLLTKLNYAGLLPGILIGLIVLSIRVARDSRRTALRNLALAVGAGLSPVLLLVAYESLKGHALLGPFAHITTLDKGSLLDQVNYMWQLYLPRIPGTVSDFPSVFPLRQFWFNGFVGLYGWRDTKFPGWVYNAALIPAAIITVLCVRALIQSRTGVRERVAELAVYAIVSLGVMAMIGAASYGAFPKIDAEYFEVRYLFPMLALLGAALTLAARGAGRRWGPVVGMLIVMLFVAHDIFSQLLLVGRYYG
jgi:hypothetical protein